MSDGFGQATADAREGAVLVLPESRGYRLKRLFLGKPKVTEQLGDERLSSPVALGVLSPDCISSSAYGTEEMLRILVPAVGLAAFTLVVPITVAILTILFFVTLSYREVVMAYTRAGGSYVVARDNFGLGVAQVAAVALLIDYTVTVAVQSAAGTDALVSAIPVLVPYVVPITVGIVVLLIYGNLRGIREAGRMFAFPTYFFIVVMGLVIIVGSLRAILGQLPRIDVHAHGALHLGSPGSGLLMGASLAIVLRAFANGGSSLTGLEAISNGVSAFRRPEGVRARRTLVVMSTILGCLVLGVTMLAHVTHAIPYISGAPTVISQEAKVVLGTGTIGRAGYYVVQLATLLILWTGANTSFNGFPFLASFVAGDSFLPRKLRQRGHRLAFSNGILLLGVVSIVLLIVTRARVDALVAVYAIGVFTGFTMAGAGMVKHHLSHRERGWRYKIWINGVAAVLSGIVVFVFAVFKFTQGAWVVVLLFPIMVFGLMRLNRQYREEAEVLGESVAEREAETQALPRQVALVFVDQLDLATARAVQYARTLNVDELRAIHLVIDAQVARRLQERWSRLGFNRLRLELVECPDRRVVRGCVQVASEEAADGRTQVSILLPRRSYSRMWARFLHDQTADRIAAAASRLQHVNATIVPFDVDAALRSHRRAQREAPALGQDMAREEEEEDRRIAAAIYGATPIGSLRPRTVAKVVGRVHSVTCVPWGDEPTLECTLVDETGKLTVAFLGRRELAGIEPSVRLAVEGRVAVRYGKLVMINPTYDLLSPASGATP